MGTRIKQDISAKNNEETLDHKSTLKELIVWNVFKCFADKEIRLVLVSTHTKKGEKGWTILLFIRSWTLF